ncbi:hypothetical protein ACFX15_028639 [Malus domestica]
MGQLNPCSLVVLDEIVVTKAEDTETSKTMSPEPNKDSYFYVHFDSPRTICRLNIIKFCGRSCRKPRFETLLEHVERGYYFLCRVQGEFEGDHDRESEVYAYDFPHDTDE